MESILYLFSQFTPEALLFEAWLLFILIASYAAFYIFRKRRYGLAEATVPTGLVKVYLSQLVTDAQRMRAQLFGILKSSGVRVSDAELKAALEAADAEGLDALIANLRGPASSPLAAAGASATLTATAGAAAASDPGVQRQLIEVEGKLQRQAEAIQRLQDEKTKLQSELEDARSGLAAAAPTGPGKSAPAGSDAELRKKLKDLEDRLEEYSVIEDDLANLKRLQQENAQLKAALQGKDGPAPATAEAATDMAIQPETIAAELDAGAAVPVDSPVADALVGDAPSETVPSEATSPSDLPSAEAPTEALADPLFDTAAELAQAPVDASLEAPTEAPTEATIEPEIEAAALSDEAPVAAADATIPTDPSAATPSLGESTEPSKSEADLVAEFEKMLQ